MSYTLWWEKKHNNPPPHRVLNLISGRVNNCLRNSEHGSKILKIKIVCLETLLYYTSDIVYHIMGAYLFHLFVVAQSHLQQDHDVSKCF